MDFRKKIKIFRQLLLQYSKLKVSAVLHCQTIAGIEMGDERHQSEVVSGSHDEVIKVRFLNVDNGVLLIPSPVCEKMVSEHFLFQFTLLSYIQRNHRLSSVPLLGY